MSKEVNEGNEGSRNRGVRGNGHSQTKLGSEGCTVVGDGKVGSGGKVRGGSQVLRVGRSLGVVREGSECTKVRAVARVKISVRSVKISVRSVKAGPSEMAARMARSTEQ